MAKKKDRCIQCGRDVENDIRCASCKARNKHASPDQNRRKRARR